MAIALKLQVQDDEDFYELTLLVGLSCVGILVVV